MNIQTTIFFINAFVSLPTKNQLTVFNDQLIPISFSFHRSPHELIVNLHFLSLISILAYDLFIDDNPFDELIEYVGIQFLYIRILLDDDYTKTLP